MEGDYMNEIKLQTHNLKAYAGYLNDDNELAKSASGGAFYALARQTLKNNGYVCGAVYSDDFKSVLHICSKDINDIEKMRGSKYARSRISPDLFHEVKNLLENGMPVLFSGTPCQVGALKAFLKNDYNSLVTCDLICHGVALPKVYQDFIDELEKQHKSQIVELNFRPKKDGWSLTYPVIVRFKNGMIFYKQFEETPFGFAFLKNIGLEDSCYNCKFKDFNRVSDVTIGDYWGVSKNAEYYNSKGTSALIANTQKGIDVLVHLEGFSLFETDYDNVTKGNPCLVAPVRMNINREHFVKVLNSRGLIAAVKKCDRPKTLKGYLSRYMPQPFKRLLKRFV